MGKWDEMRVQRIENALKWPTLAKEEGFGGLQSEFHNVQTQCSNQAELMTLLVEHLGLEIEEGKRIIKKASKK